ncbi:MAG TPA: glutathione S-transferase family protein [Candidatus Binataceae bacterium]|nr:glutathione S-transferase family protein [Candidatus Binataceae bacterium]
MKLYSMNLSNFATKSRIAIYDKGLKIEIVAPPGGDLHSTEYLKVNPLGKIPALDADGLIIAESEVINEYLEDKFPTPALLPKSAEGRARVRLFTRFHDLYLEPPLRALFPMMNPKTRDEKVVAEKLKDLSARLDQLEKMLADSGFACGADFTLADCALAPTMFFIANLLPMFGAKPAVEGRPKLTAWWHHVQSRPSVKKGLAEMAEAMAAMQRGGRA